jgi:hypothetical protein
MPRVLIEEKTAYVEDYIPIAATCSVETQPIPKSNDKSEENYDLGENQKRSKYAKRFVDPNDRLKMSTINKIKEIGSFNDQISTKTRYDIFGFPGRNITTTIMDLTPHVYESQVLPLLQTIKQINGGSRRRRRPSRKYKKSAKRVFRKKSRSTRRR